MKPDMRVSTAILTLAAILSVAGCKTTTTPVIGKALNGVTGMHDEREARLSTAANNAIAEGKTNEALALYGKLYASNKSQDAALNYAQLLRKTGKAQQALDVLAPFVTNRDGTIKGY